MARPELERTLRAIFRDRRDKTLFISGDPGLRYGEVVELIDAAKAAGVERVGVITPEMRGQGDIGDSAQPRGNAGATPRTLERGLGSWELRSRTALGLSGGLSLVQLHGLVAELVGLLDQRVLLGPVGLGVRLHAEQDVLEDQTPPRSPG